jgi:hypothetical protein
VLVSTNLLKLHKRFILKKKHFPFLLFHDYVKILHFPDKRLTFSDESFIDIPSIFDNALCTPPAFN